MSCRGKPDTCGITVDTEEADREQHRARAYGTPARTAGGPTAPRSGALEELIGSSSRRSEDTITTRSRSSSGRRTAQAEDRKTRRRRGNDEAWQQADPDTAGEGGEARGMTARSVPRSQIDVRLGPETMTTASRKACTRVAADLGRFAPVADRELRRERLDSAFQEVRATSPRRACSSTSTRRRCRHAKLPCRTLGDRRDERRAEKGEEPEPGRAERTRSPWSWTRRGRSH